MLSDHHKALRERARALAQGHVAARAAEVDSSEDYPWDTVARMTEAGFFGLTIPERYGGGGGSTLDAMLVIEEMAKVCGVTGRIAVEANMGAIGAIMAYGTEDQRKAAADLVLSGDKPAICITEPAAGSAATDMTTRADKRGNRYVLNGAKHWITGAGVSKLHLIFARVFDEKGEEEGIAGFIAVRDDTPGLRIGKREPTMGLRGMPEAEVFFEDMELAPLGIAAGAARPAQGFRRFDGGLQRPARRRRHGRPWPRRGRLRAGPRLQPGARAVRPADLRVPGPTVDARRHEHSDRGGARPPLRRRGRRGRRLPRSVGGGPGQGVRLGDGDPRDQRCPPGVSAPRATRGPPGSNAWCAMPACSRSAAARRRFCAP